MESHNEYKILVTPRITVKSWDPRFVASNSHAFNGTGGKNGFMHNKVMIIDDKVVIAGSYKFSENAEANDENLLSNRPPWRVPTTSTSTPIQRTLRAPSVRD